MELQKWWRCNGDRRYEGGVATKTIELQNDGATKMMELQKWLTIENDGATKIVELKMVVLEKSWSNEIDGVTKMMELPKW